MVGHSRRDLPRDRASRWVRSSTSFYTHELAHTMYVYEDAPGELRWIDSSTYSHMTHCAGRCVCDVVQPLGS